MKIFEMFIIVVIIAVGMFGLIYIGGNTTTSPLNVTSTFGEKAIQPQILVVNTTNTTNPGAPITFANISAENNTNTSYSNVQLIANAETQGAGAGIIIVAACVVILLIFAAVVIMRGQYGRGKYRT